MTTTALIFLLFAVLHSVTVSDRFKKACRGLLGDTFMRVGYRFAYTIVSCATLAVAVFCINRVPDRTLWVPPQWLHWTMRGIQVAGAVFAVRAFEHLDGAGFLGIRQVWRYLVRGEVAGNNEGLTDRELVTTGVYGIVRHPIYFGGMLVMTFDPHLTINGLTLSVLADAYFLFGAFIEERRFLKVFNGQYQDYMARVPWLFPRLVPRSRP